MVLHLCVCFSQGPLHSGAGESEGPEERASQPVRSLSHTSPFFEPQMGPVELRAQQVMPGRRRAGCDWAAVSRVLDVSGQHQGGSWVMFCKAGWVPAPSLPAARPAHLARWNPGLPREGGAGGRGRRSRMVQSTVFRNCVCLWPQEKLKPWQAAWPGAGPCELQKQKPSWLSLFAVGLQWVLFWGGICLCEWSKYPKVIGFWFFIF